MFSLARPLTGLALVLPSYDYCDNYFVLTTWGTAAGFITTILKSVLKYGKKKIFKSVLAGTKKF